MSSRKYEVMGLELPRVSVSDCIGAALCLLCALTVEAVLCEDGQVLARSHGKFFPQDRNEAAP